MKEELKYYCPHCNSFTHDRHRCQQTGSLYEIPLKALEEWNTRQSNELASARDEAYIAANNAIYFADNSDYKSSLYEVCKKLRPDKDVGMNYYEDASCLPPKED